jgi:aliphatic sulfonates family ABC transporter substrate-binding protein
MKRTKAMLAKLATALALFIGASLADHAWAQSPLPIRIGYAVTIDWALFTAKELKLFEKAGLASTFVKFEAGAPQIEAMQNGYIDMSTPGPVAFLNGLAQGVDWVLIGISEEGAYAEGMLARKDIGIETIPDLRGRKIGYFAGSTAHYGLVMTLRQYGVRLDEVTLLQMTPEEQFVAMTNGQIDAAMVWEPMMQRMVHGANARIISREGDLGIRTNVGVYCVRRDWLRANRETAVRFLRAIVMAHEALSADPKVGIRALATEANLKESWAEAIYEVNPPPRIAASIDPRYGYSLVRGAAFHRRLGYLAAFLYEKRIIPSAVDVSEALDASVITEVLSTWESGQ